MEPIKTVSTVERILRNSIMTTMVIVFAAYFLYDGYVGYPRKNLDKARQLLPADEQGAARISKDVGSADKDTIVQGDLLKAIEARLGLPAWKGPAEDRVFKAVWFGPGGALVVHYNATSGTVVSSRWMKGQKTELDLLIQKLLGYVLMPVGLVLLVRVLLMLARGARFSDEGLQPSGGPLIPFDAMTGWDISDYREKGRIRLSYTLGGEEGVYVLDDYKLRAFPAIVKEISRRQGFENPLRDDPSGGDDAGAGPDS